MDLARHVATRDRRQEVVDGLCSQLTDALRGLHGSDVPVPIAESIVQRYAREFAGVRLDNHALVAITNIVMSPAAAAIEIEEIDDAISLVAPSRP